MNSVVPKGSESFLDYNKSLACIHCGLCLSSCPTYLETGNENDSPRGRIYLMRALQEGRLDLTAEPVRHIDLCLGCRACEAACPSGVQYGVLLEGTRAHIERRHPRSPWQQFLRRVLIEKIFPYPKRFRNALLPGHWAKRLGIGRFLPRFAREALDLLPPQDQADPLPDFSPAKAGLKRGRVGMISGCVMSVSFAATNRATMELLNRAGYDVVVPSEQGCCGALYAHTGNLSEARRCARQNIQAFEELHLDAVIINAAGCGSTLKEYEHLLHDDPAWSARGKKFSGMVKDLTEWIKPTDITLTSGKGEKVTYHDACHLAHAQRITRQPRDLVRAIAGTNFVPLNEADVCCGSAGTYNLTEPEMAARLAERKTRNILNSGAEIVVTSNPGCILQIKAGLVRAGAAHIKVMHIADFLRSRLG